MPFTLPGSTAAPAVPQLPMSPLLPGFYPAPDCAWCRYGKPAAIGAAAGALINVVLGMPATRGAAVGAVAGLAYGYVS